MSKRPIQNTHDVSEDASNEPQKKRIMISYNQASSNVLADKIFSSLSSRGYNVWIDKQNIAGNLNDAMAKAVKDSEIVLMFVTPKYETSRACKKEAEYADSLNKIIIPVHNGYKPQGWLALVEGQKLYHDFSRGEFDEVFSNLLSEIENPNKTSYGSTASTVPGLPGKGTDQPDGARQILSIGGRKTKRDVKVIHSVGSTTAREFKSLPAGLEMACSVVSQDFVYCIGGKERNSTAGWGVGSSTNNVSRLNLKNHLSEWEEISPMKERRCLMGAAAVDDIIYVVGGKGGSNFDSLSSGECYNPAEREWNEISPMNQAREGHALVLCKGHLYAIGGNCRPRTGDCDSDTTLDTVERLHPHNDDGWKSVAPMTMPRAEFAVAVVNDDIYAIGGYNGTCDNAHLTAEKYDSSMNKWSKIRGMREERHSSSACVIQNKIYVTGGYNRENKGMSSVICYDPRTDKWSNAGTSEVDLVDHTVVAV